MRLLVLVSLSLVALTASARIVPAKDPLDGVLDADLVVIVGPALNGKPGAFRISEVFLGDLHVGDTIELSDFKLFIVQEYGPEKVEPITAETRILLYLRRTKDSPPTWKPTYFEESIFWVQRAQDEGLLRRAAERTIDVRRQWEAADNISDPKQRVAALWPYLSLFTYGVSFFKHTVAELRKARPASGEYFAAHFDGMSHGERMLLLPEAGNFGSDQLHEKLKRDLELQEHGYEDFISGSGKRAADIEWDTMPSSAKDEAGEIYYGLAGLSKFEDRTDLPFIRATALWCAKYHLEQAASAAVNAFRDMPDQGNLPIIDALLREFLPGRKVGIWSIDWDAERALCRHKYIKTVPVLAPFVADPITQLAGEAEICLKEIVGKDLGRDPTRWQEWYKEKTKSETDHTAQE